MKTIISTVVAAFTFVAGTGVSQAETVWVTPFKGAPYATQIEAAPQVTTKQAAVKQTLRYAKIARKARGANAHASAQ